MNQRKNFFSQKNFFQAILFRLAGQSGFRFRFIPGKPGTAGRPLCPGQVFLSAPSSSPSDFHFSPIFLQKKHTPGLHTPSGCSSQKSKKTINFLVLWQQIYQT